MTPQELYRNGRLREAITALGDELKRTLSTPSAGPFCSSFCCLPGNMIVPRSSWKYSPARERMPAPGTLLYRSALHAERTRQDMFAQNRTPPLESREQTGGLCDGRPFSEFIDSDPRIGPDLEVYIAGSYTCGFPLPTCARSRSKRRSIFEGPNVGAGAHRNHS